jgi:outer membrane protein OmpA-like peptidoglycan-associated protein
MLMNEADSIRAAAPAGLGALLGGPTSGMAGEVNRAVSAMTAPAKRGGWGWAAIAAAIILGLLWFATRGKTPPETSVAADTAAGTPAADVQAYSPAAGQNVTLPNGTTLNVPSTSLESQVVAFITDSTRPVDKTTWFNFDRLLFETGSATLKPASQAQLRNVAAIFAAFPSVKAKIGGYTDNTGNAAANMQLSQDRASSVMNELVGLGVDKARLAAEGYGDQHPVADNATEEGRAQNRRIAMRITEK